MKESLRKRIYSSATIIKLKKDDIERKINKGENDMWKRNITFSCDEISLIIEMLELIDCHAFVICGAVHEHEQTLKEPTK
jgi:hypothetical protein